MPRKRKSKKKFHPAQALSPLRYPGGKSWLTPIVAKWLATRDTGTKHRLVEPFAGGANVGLTMLASGKVGTLTIVELDRRIASFWKAVLRDPEYLIRGIRRFKATRKNLVRWLQRKPKTYRQLAFQTLLKNRTSRGGVLTPRSGVLKRGERDRGPFSRWYPETLVKRIRAISRLQERITLIHGDGLQVIRQRKRRRRDVYFVDPPYSFSRGSAGRRLYVHHDVPHESLMSALKGVNGAFLLTYDDEGGIRRLAKRHRLLSTSIKMKNSHHASKRELLISNDLKGIKRGARGKRKARRS